MSFGSNHPPRDEDDMFADTRMTFGEHIEDLRVHLWRALIGFGIILVLCLALDAVGYATGTGIGVGKPMTEFIARPVEVELQDFYDRRNEKIRQELERGATSGTVAQANEPKEVELQVDPRSLARVLGLDPAKVPPAEGDNAFANLPVRIKPVELALATSQAQRLVGRRPALSTLSVSEAMMVYLKVAIVSGFILASPWVFWQVWSFVAVGLYPHEKRYVNIYLPFSLGLFLVGILVCQFIVLPRAVAALLWFNEWIGLEPDLRLNEWLGFAIMMPLVFGLSFQTPLVMLFLERIGIMSIDAYRSKRRMIWFIMAIFAAIITPSVDAVSLLFLWVPMGMLFELGIWLCKLAPRHGGFDVDVPEPEEMVEV